MDQKTRVTNEQIIGEGHLNIVVDGKVVRSWDISGLSEDMKRKVGDRIAHYGGSQLMGVPEERVP